MMISPIFKSTLTVLYLTGSLVCIYLVYLSIAGGADFMCQVFQTDCLGVIRSDYSTLAGMSVSSLGFGYFLVLLLLIIFSGVHPFIPFIAVLLNIAGVFASIYFLYVLNIFLSVGCSWCYGVHGVNLIALSVIFTGWKQSGNKGKKNAQNQKNPGNPMVLILFCLVFVSSVLGVNLFETHHALTIEKQKLSNNLFYHQYHFDEQIKHEFIIDPGDNVIGEKAIALHQIVLIYRDGCSSCKQSKEKLSALVKDHGMAIYLLLKNVDTLPKTLLEVLNITHVPVVFIDGKQADGWELPGFMDPFVEDCGC